MDHWKEARKNQGKLRIVVQVFKNFFFIYLFFFSFFIKKIMYKKYKFNKNFKLCISNKIKKKLTFKICILDKI